MANASLPSSSRDDDLVIYVPSSATPTVDKEQLKFKFKLASIDDMENKKIHLLKEKANEIKKLLSMRTDRFTIAAHGVTKSHLANWWSNFGFAKETVSGEIFSVSNFVSCEKCFTTYRYGSSSTETISRHECDGSISSSVVAEHSFTLDKHFIKQKISFRHAEQQHLTKLFSIWISDSLRPISIVEDPGLREICSYFYDLGKFFFF